MHSEQNIKPSLFGRTFTNDQDSSTFLVESEPIEGTPFRAMRYSEEWFLVWGEYKISKSVESAEAAKTLLETELWNIIAVYTVCVLEQYKKQNR